MFFLYKKTCFIKYFIYKIKTTLFSKISCNISAIGLDGLEVAVKRLKRGTYNECNYNGHIVPTELAAHYKATAGKECPGLIIFLSYNQVNMCLRFHLINLFKK